VPLALLGAPTGADQLVVRAPGAAPVTTFGRIRVDDLLSAKPVPLWRSLPRLPDRIAAAAGSLLAPWLVGGGAILALVAAFGLLRGARRTRADLAWLLVLAFASGALWAGLTPAWSKTDEVAHFAYVQAVATQGHPPAVGDLVDVSVQLSCWEADLGIQRYRFFDSERPPWFLAPNTGYVQTCGKQSPVFDGASYAADQPPAYYYMAAVPYLLASSATLPTKLLAVRLFSVLLAAIAVLLTYLLVLEVIPGSRWPARAGAAALALQPIFMFNTSGVNPDALVVAVTAAIAYVVARAWRRGFGLRSALVLGALTGLGIVSKLNFLTLLPSVALLGAALWWARYARGSWRERGIGAARAAAGALVALAVYEAYIVLNNDVWNRVGAASRGATIATSTSGVNLRRLGDFVWQFFLPRLPGRPHLFAYYPLWNDILKAITTRLGWWNVFGFDPWAPVLVVLGFVIAAAASVYIVPRARRRPWPPLIALVALAGFVVALVVADYQVLGAGGDGFEGRYVFPALPLWGLLVGCAVATAPVRWRAPATGLLVALFVGHTVLAIASATSIYYL
jgi:4-amino-4-deoxy-L-arabinose transferase-like glycosyltransferase